MSTIVNTVLVNYTGYNKTSEQAWDYLQRTMKCCGWTGPSNWTENLVINSQKNNSVNLYPCSCRNESINGTEIKESGLCETFSPAWPVFTTGCMSSMEDWLLRKSGVILGVCVGIAVIELLGMILSMCLCKSVQQEDYTKVPKYWEQTPLQTHPTSENTSLSTPATTGTKQTRPHPLTHIHISVLHPIISFKHWNAILFRINILRWGLWYLFLLKKLVIFSC